MQMVMTSDETQIQIFADWPMPQAKRATKDNRKNPDYQVVEAIRKMWTDETVSQKNQGQTMLKVSSMSDLKRPTAQAFSFQIRYATHFKHGLVMILLRNGFCLSSVSLSRQRHDILDFRFCPLSRV